MEGIDHQHFLKQTEEKEYEEYDYENDNAGSIYDEDIDYNEEIDQEEMDGLLEDNERNSNVHQ